MAELLHKQNAVVKGGVEEITQIKCTSYTTSASWSLSLTVPVKFITLARYDTGGVEKLIDIERAIQIYSSDTYSYCGGRYDTFLKIDSIHSFNVDVDYGNITISDDFKTVSGDKPCIMVSIWG